MREILFRGKRVDNGEWIEGCNLIQDSDIEDFEIGGYNYYNSNEGLQREPFLYKVIPETIGQYTGLKDKNGNKIFEGDIALGYFKGEKIVGYIYYGSEASFFIQRKGLYGIGLNNANDWLKIIGNIHDNIIQNYRSE